MLTGRRPAGLLAGVVFLALSVAVAPALAHDSFASFLDSIRREAARAGVSQATLDAALANLSPDPEVIERDRNQPEFDWTFSRYLEVVVSEEQIANGRARFAEHRALLDEVSARYGVPPQVIAALWGVESRYGARTGDFDIVRSLATLASDTRRPARFRPELIAALKILDGGHVDAGDWSGSWAGASGQVQFMPTSFVAYAVDYDGDGRRDIWHTPADIFASAANYLVEADWNPGLRWGREVTLPAGFDAGLAGRERRRTLDAWRRLGLVAGSGGGNIRAALLLPDGPGGRAFLIYRNFDVIRRWNPSDWFVLAVGVLSDRIAE